MTFYEKATQYKTTRQHIKAAQDKTQQNKTRQDKATKRKNKNMTRQHKTRQDNTTGNMLPVNKSLQGTGYHMSPWVPLLVRIGKGQQLDASGGDQWVLDCKVPAMVKYTVAIGPVLNDFERTY